MVEGWLLQLGEDYFRDSQDAPLDLSFLMQGEGLFSCVLADGAEIRGVVF